MRSTLNISIDDVSPHPMASIKVVERCYELIDEFPDIKFTLFVPIAYWRTIGKTATDMPLRIDKFSDFCESLKSLPVKNFEIGYHGLFHGIPYKSNNDEFQYLNYKEAKDGIKKMIDVVHDAGLQDVFKKIFRPPAWRMSPDAFRAFEDFDFEILALSPKQYAKEIYASADEKFKNKVVYYNVNPPFEPLRLFKQTEIVYHACEWDRNFLSHKMKDELSSFIENNLNKIEFVFMRDV